MAITYSISGGADAAKFNIDAATGKLTFKAAPDFEKPGDANTDNIYEVTVKATDAGGASSTQDMRVTVKDVSENLPPQITSAAAVAVNENQTAVTTVTATDPDDGGTPVPPDPGPPSTFWTTFAETAPSGEGSTFTGAGTRKIYVAASGNDGNPGTQSSPKKTINGGKALLRDGKPDWLLFKKGDTWTNESFGNLSGRKGLSPTAPMLFGAYGSGKRPLFQTAVDDAMGFYSDSANNIAVVGLELYAYKRDPKNSSFDANSNAAYNHGFICNAPSNYLLIEDCKFACYGDNVVVQGAIDVFKFRRNVVVDSYIKSSSVHSQGLYTQNIKNQIIEENIFDHCGWNSTVGGAAGPTIYNRNAYLDAESGPATVIGNWFSASSSEGAQVRSAGTIKGNFFYQNMTGFNVGSDDLPFKVSDTSDNVIMHSQSGRPGRHGYGICILNVQTSGVQIHNNIISHTEETDDPPDGRGLFLDQKTSQCVMTNNIIFKWKLGILNYGNANNVIEPNSIDLAGTNTAGYSAPNRDLGDYYASVGGSNSSDAFIAAIRNQSKDTWNDKLTAKAVVNYIRGGFDMAPI